MINSKSCCGTVTSINCHFRTSWSKHQTRLTAWLAAQLRMPNLGNSWAAKGTETGQMCALECSRDESPTPSHWRVPLPTTQWLGASVQPPGCCPAQSPAALLSDGPPACMTFPGDAKLLFVWSCLHPAKQGKSEKQILHRPVIVVTQHSKYGFMLHIPLNRSKYVYIIS